MPAACFTSDCTTCFPLCNQNFYANWSFSSHPDNRLGMFLPERDLFHDIYQFYIAELHAHSSTSTIRQLFRKHSYLIHYMEVSQLYATLSQNCYKGFTVLCTTHAITAWKPTNSSISIQCTFYRKGTFCTTFSEILCLNSGLWRTWTAPILEQNEHYCKTPQNLACKLLHHTTFITSNTRNEGNTFYKRDTIPFHLRSPGTHLGSISRAH